MRQEVQNWFRQAEADWRSARNSREAGDYYMSVFASQQAAEKALKALSLFKLKEYAKGHSIIYLAQRLGVPESMTSGIRDLNPEYLSTRYPDMAAGIPAELYDDKIAGRHPRTAQEVLEWVREQIRK